MMSANASIPVNVCVVVLGDIGRSPRMQYHAYSLAREGYNVNIVGYAGSKPIKGIQEHPNVLIRHLKSVPDFHKYFPRVIGYMLKVLWQCLTLLWALILTRRSDHLLLQTPPAIPALSVCWIYCIITGTNFIIDWHNYAYSIMALSLGKNNKLVKFSEWFEGYFGRKANANLCVTKAMKDDLKSKWNIEAVTLYDRPPESFRSVTVEETHTMMNKYPEMKCNDQSCTKFTKVIDEKVVLREDRPGLVVSSTSWTEDEDFSLLFFALKEYDECDAEDLPELECVITGKGPLKEYFMKKVKETTWSKVNIVSLWLEPEDYPVLLASADLGVSLHTSSSGLDLPMKVVDMFGCGLPVAALHFQCLNELVHHEENSNVFHDSKELAQQFQDWFKGFPNNQDKHVKYKQELEKFQQLRWHDNWSFQALPLFKK